MIRELASAYIAKENAESFLSNLENLKADGSMTDSLYDNLKSEYTAMYEKATANIDTIKKELQNEYDAKTKETRTYHDELDNLETRLKVGQMPERTFAKLSKAPRQRAAVIDKQLAILKMGIDAEKASDLERPKEEKARKPRISLAKKLFSLPKKPTSPPPGKEPKQVEEALPEIPPPPPPPSYLITDLQIMPERVVQTSNIGIVASIVNPTHEQITDRLELLINGELVNSLDLTLEPQEMQEVTFVTVANEPGDQQVTVGNHSGTFYVIPKKDMGNIEEDVVELEEIEVIAELQEPEEIEDDEEEV